MVCFRLKRHVLNCFIFSDYDSLRDVGVKEKNTKTNKIKIVKNQKLATQNFLFNIHMHFPFGNI
jgi:hypothetical protein